MKRLALILPALALAACKQQPQPEPAPTPTVAMPRALVAADFDTLELGPRVEGPQGDEVSTVLSSGPDEIGTMVSYVTCPKGLDECRPAALPEGTVYTYVYRITVAERDDAAGEVGTPSPAASGTAVEAGATLLRTATAVPNFNHAIGYSRSEAEAALGAADAIAVTSDDGHLIWRVTKGEGWKPETSITFWWTSTMPPRFREMAYSLEIGGKTATITAPFPMEEKPVEGEKRR